MQNFIPIFCIIGVVLGTSSKTDPGLTSMLNTQGTANIFITFASENEQLYENLETQSFSTRAQKIEFLTTRLQSQASIAQQNVVNLLNTNRQYIDYKSFWISNQIFIANANKSLIDTLAKFPEVASIEEEIIVTLESPIQTPSENPQQSGESWGIKKIQAPDIWNVTKGKGIVVANIDSGVRYTHEALRDNFRLDYGWYDPFNKTLTPNDQGGHGTHTMGTLAGTRGIGVAPESKWIACKGCYVNVCPQRELTACAQWIQCPFRPNGSQQNCNASMAPHIVSNSWGSDQGNNKWFESIAKAWVNAGIIPVFSIGNAGPACSTNGSPGDMSGVIGVGSTDSNDAVSSFSSRGPTSDGRIKPDISAPGRDIRSASNRSDSDYVTNSGTSMAAPHVAGTIALMLSKRNGTMKFDDVRKILERTVDKNLKTTEAQCGNVKDSKFPNNHFGYGRLNALKAVNSSRKTTFQNDKLILLAFLSFFIVKALLDKH